jgi:hypothetical protein
VTLATSGFHWWGESVTSTSCYISQGINGIHFGLIEDFQKNCYFLNFGEVFIAAIIGTLVGYHWCREERRKKVGWKYHKKQTKVKNNQ